MISVLPTLLHGLQYSTVDRACLVDWLVDQKPAMTSMHEDNIDTTLRVRAVLYCIVATLCNAMQPQLPYTVFLECRNPAA